MREIFKGRIKWVILISLVVVVGIGITFILVFSDSNKNFDTKDSSKIITDIKEELELKKDLEEQEQKIENKGEESIDVVEKETTTNNTPKTNEKDSSSTNSKTSNTTSSNKTNTSSNQTTTNNNSSNSNANSNSNNTVSNNNETPKQETPKQETPSKPSEDLTKIANPNDFFYSITGGNAEFSTNAGCMKAGEDIAFIDVVDVQYFRCYEVMSKANTIMGYYLNIFCESGNCNSRYKSMINISSYD